MSEIANTYIIEIILLLFFISIIGIAFTSAAKLRPVIAFLFLFSVFIVFSAASDLLGRAKPLSLLGYGELEEVELISGFGIKDQGIYLILLIDKTNPRFFVIPWSEEAEKQMVEAQDGSERQGVKTIANLRNIYKFSPDRNEQMFYPAPQRPLPDKPDPGEGITVE